MTPTTTHPKTLEIQSRTELLSEVRSFVSLAATEFGFNTDDVAKIELAVDEACTNIIKHAYRYDPKGNIHIHLSFNRNQEPPQFIVKIFDNGLPFDSSKYTTPDMQEYFQKLRHGGLGILLMKKLMDEVEYNVGSGVRNSITLIKNLKTQQAAA